MINRSGRISNNTVLLLYYCSLLLVMFTGATFLLSTPPMFLRLALLVAVVFPLLFSKSRWTPIILSLFLIISHNSFAHFLPDNVFVYYMIVLCLFFQKRRKNHLNIFPILLFLIVFAFMVNLYNDNDIELYLFYLNLFFLFIFPFFVPRNDIEYPHYFSYVFIISSLFLSVLFFFLGKEFVKEVKGDFEIYTWKDPNYFCAMLGMGIVASFIEFYSSKRKEAYSKLFNIVVIAVDLIVILLTASRGALLSISVAFVFLLLFSSFSIRYKLLSVLILALLIFLAFRYKGLDFILYRLSEENSLNEGSGRINIWMSKLLLFINGTLSQQVFGFGYEGGLSLGADGKLSYYGKMSTHNDFLSFLIYYGYVGFVTFICILSKPLRNGNNRSVVFCGTAFLVTSCFTIEPFAVGNIAWYAFLFYIYVWSQTPEISGRFIKLKGEGYC